MEIIEVKNKRDWSLFHQVLTSVYQQVPNYIYPLHKQVEETFDPAINQVAGEGISKCFVLLDEQQQPVGRIAAFIDPGKNTQPEQPKVGGIGFFECTHHPVYARALFERAFALVVLECA